MEEEIAPAFDEGDAVALPCDCDAAAAGGSPQDDHRRREAFDQWDALLEREGRYACYALSEPPAAETAEAALDRRRKGRESLCLWAFEVVDHHDVDRRTVAIGLSYFDRLVANGLVEDSPARLRLVGMTCLYLAMKVHSHSGKQFGAAAMASYSRGFFTEAMIVDAEQRICGAFDWRLNPPVADMCVDVLEPLLEGDPMIRRDDDDGLGGLPGDAAVAVVAIPKSARRELVRQSRYLCALSVVDPFLASAPPSAVAHAAVLVSMDLLRFPAAALTWFAGLPLDRDVPEADMCVGRLRRICGEEGFQRPEVTFDDYCVEEAEGGRGARFVTPEKGDAPLDLKRVRREAIEGLSPVEEALPMSPKKQRIR